ncbi:hypothetical protein EYF80_021677 [Liparis tanakae]|uniref:Uncharacterized protein n=1 Tax=Liparis tanakae TaxID=230148 RepID=A0A4Z2HT57_9TELE|nr:hypothetical protein EYF80_021677 [Liparis tanakae]
MLRYITVAVNVHPIALFLVPTIEDLCSTHTEPRGHKSPSPNKNYEGVISPAPNRLGRKAVWDQGTQLGTKKTESATICFVTSRARFYLALQKTKSEQCTTWHQRLVQRPKLCQKLIRSSTEQK